MDNTELNLPFSWIPRTVGWVLLVMSSFFIYVLIQAFPVFYLIITNGLVAIASMSLIIGVIKKSEAYFRFFLASFYIAILIHLFALLYLIWTREDKVTNNKASREEMERYGIEFFSNLTITVIYIIFSWIMDKYWKEIQKSATNSVAVV